MQTANQAALSLTLALEGIKGVSLSVSYFPCSDEDKQVCTVISSHQRVRQHAAYFDQKPIGSTPMSNAIWNAAYQLLGRSEKRKVILVITDGDSDDVQGTKEVIKRCQASGFEMLGIGIETMSVKSYFPKSVVIRDVRELRDVLFQLAEQMIVG